MSEAISTNPTIEELQALIKKQADILSALHQNKSMDDLVKETERIKQNERERVALENAAVQLTADFTPILTACQSLSIPKNVVKCGIECRLERAKPDDELGTFSVIGRPLQWTNTLTRTDREKALVSAIEAEANEKIQKMVKSFVQNIYTPEGYQDIIEKMSFGLDSLTDIVNSIGKITSPLKLKVSVDILYSNHPIVKKLDNGDESITPNFYWELIPNVTSTVKSHAPRQQSAANGRGHITPVSLGFKTWYDLAMSRPDGDIGKELAKSDGVQVKHSLFKWNFMGEKINAEHTQEDKDKFQAWVNISHPNWKYPE